MWLNDTSTEESSERARELAGRRGGSNGQPRPLEQKSIN